MMDHDERDWRRQARHLTGEGSPGERASLLAWIIEKAGRARLADELRQVWSATEKPPSAQRDTDAAWQELRAKIREAGTASGKGGTRPARALRPDRPVRSDRRARARRRADVLRGRRRTALPAIAAVSAIAVVALLVTFLTQEGLLAPSTTEARVFATKKGQRATLRLSDGTQVRLNVDSRLTFTEGFGSEQREVRLDGEGYFEVARNEERPFLVQAGGATVRVLGTAFNVRAYTEGRGEDQVEVAVAEGEVALVPKTLVSQQKGAATPAASEVSADTLLLRSHHLGVVSGSHLLAVREGVDLGRELAWTKGRLVFRDAPFSEVLRELERWYDLQVEAPRVVPGTVDHLNATFDDEPLEEALQAIAAALDLDYSREKRTVFFYPKGEAPPGNAAGVNEGRDRST